MPIDVNTYVYSHRQIIKSFHALKYLHSFKKIQLWGLAESTELLLADKQLRLWRKHWTFWRNKHPECG